MTAAHQHGTPAAATRSQGTPAWRLLATLGFGGAFAGALIANVYERTLPAIRAAAEGRIHPDRLILIAPAVWGWKNMPQAYRVALWVAAHTRPAQIVTPPKNLKIVASDNIKVLRENWKDPLFLKKTRVDAVYGLVDMMETAARDLPRVGVPIAYLYGGEDQLITMAPTRRALRGLPPGARTAFYPGGHHLLVRDHASEPVMADVLAFSRDPSAPWPSGAGPIPLRDR